MICPLCNGHRLFFFHGQLVPCPHCNGQGEIHCCDGLQEQSDPDTQPNTPDTQPPGDGKPAAE